jgi:histone-lysine N-methyltransferase EZH2
MSLDASTSDNTGPFATPDPVPSPNSDDETITENRAFAFLVYKEVWDEFNKWKVEDCKRQLRLLEQPLPPQNVSEAAKEMASAFRTDGDGHDDVEIIYICDTEDDVPLDVGGATVLTCKAVSLEIPPDFEPHPPYEACTPSVQSIAIREAYDMHETVYFVPYADDPTWDARDYLNQFAIFAWEKLADPDGRPVPPCVGPLPAGPYM